MSDSGNSDIREVARDLHSVALHMLRRLRRVDADMGIGTPRASALSILVFSGPTTIGALAEAEQVRPPTMTRLVDRLERDGLARREPSADDRRAVLVHATPRGRRLLEEGRARRVAALARELETLDAAEITAVAKAVDILRGTTANA